MFDDCWSVRKTHNKTRHYMNKCVSYTTHSFMAYNLCIPSTTNRSSLTISCSCHLKNIKTIYFYSLIDYTYILNNPTLIQALKLVIINSHMPSSTTKTINLKNNTINLQHNIINLIIIR